MASEEYAACHATLRESQKQCKMLYRQVSRGSVCMRALFVLSATLAVGAVFMLNDLKSFDMKKLLVDFNLL